MEFKETTTQYTLQVAFSGISILCCLVVTIGFIAFKNLRKSALKLVLFLCISEMIFSISMIMRPPNQENNQLCGAQIFLSNLGHLSTLFWTCMISYTLHRSIKYGYDHVRCIMKKIIITSLIVPTLLASMIFMRQYLFTQNDFCSVLQEGIEGTTVSQGEYSFFIQKLIMLLEFQIPIYISFVFNLKQVFSVAKIAKESNVQNATIKLRRIYLYPFIIPVCQIFSLIYQVYILFGGDPANYQLITLNIILSCSQGAINSVVYGFNQKLKHSFKSAYHNSRNSSSTTSTTLNESLIHKNSLSSSAIIDSPEKRRIVYKSIAKAYQTASEDEDDERMHRSNYHRHSSSRSSMQNNTTRASIQNSTKHTSNSLNTIPEMNYETPSNSRKSHYKKNRYTSSDHAESDSNNEIGEQSDDLYDDIISNHSTPSKQFQLTIADF